MRAKLRALRTKLRTLQVHQNGSRAKYYKPMRHRRSIAGEARNLVRRVQYVVCKDKSLAGKEKSSGGRAELTTTSRQGVEGRFDIPLGVGEYVEFAGARALPAGST
jgi:hypothetical protein